MRLKNRIDLFGLLKKKTSEERKKKNKKKTDDLFWFGEKNRPTVK